MPIQERIHAAPGGTCAHPGFGSDRSCPCGRDTYDAGWRDRDALATQDEISPEPGAEGWNGDQQ